MPTRFDRIPAGAELAALIRSLRDGGVALLPTDTIYGFHAQAGSTQGIDRITAMKGRDDTKPFVILGESVDQLERMGARLTPALRAALEAIWPAPLTAVIPLEQPVPATRGLGVAALRVPAVDWLRELLRGTGPLASTSANRSRDPVVTRPSDLAYDLQMKVDAVVDLGLLEGQPSTIVDFTAGPPRLVREGDPLFAQSVWKRLRKSL